MNGPTERTPLISTERIREIREHLLAGLVERDLPIRLALLAALTGEHLLMVGPPGTAKSLVARRLHEAFADTRYFERLLTRFSVPEELFGPLSIKGLEQDRYERLTESYLPTASIAFLDEVFKANSAILNSLLTLLNEREFDNGTQRIKTPLVAVIGASNELPEGEELDALFDRFLLRLHVGPVSAEGFANLLTLKGSPAVDMPDALKLTSDELLAFQAQAESVALSPEIIQLLGELRTWCAEQQLMVSDRRWRKIVKLLQTSALSNGRQQVSIWDVWLLPHCLWSNAEQRASIEEWYAKRIGATQAVKPERLIRQIAVWEATLQRDLEVRAHMCNERGELLYVTPQGEQTTEAGAKGVPRTAATPLKFVAPIGATRLQPTSDAPFTIDNDGKGFTRQELDRLYLPDHSCHFENWRGKPAYLSNEDNLLSSRRRNEPLMGPQHKQAYVTDRLRQVERLAVEVEDHQRKLQLRIKEVQVEVGSHLWVTSDFCAKASEELTEADRSVGLLKQRLDALRSGYQALPLEPDFLELALDDVVKINEE